MSTAQPTTFPEPEIPPDDPFFLGRRYVDHGTYVEEVPLTLEDVLHPQEEDRVTVNDPHVALCFYLRGGDAAAGQGYPRRHCPVRHADCLGRPRAWGAWT